MITKFKISFSDKHVFPNKTLSALLCSAGNPDEALNAVELGRARAVADLMSAQHCVDKHIPTSTRLWDAIDRIKRKPSSCTCLYTLLILLKEFSFEFAEQAESRISGK